MVEAEHCLWDYQSFLSHDGNEVKVNFHPIPTQEVQEEIFSQSVSQESGENLQDQSSIKKRGKKSEFGSQPDFNDPNFDFSKELKRLPFPLNLVEVDMSRAQQVRFLELIYDNQMVFSLCDEDLGMCDCLKHTIPITKDEPVYLPHRTIPVQLQAEVRNCLDAWLQQRIIQPLHSPYTSQVVIVHKKSGKICLCIDYRALNAITVHDSFPLPRIEEALQAVKVAVWFTSFDLAQGYLQLAMDEVDIHKTEFWAGSSRLYEFTHMPFGLSNASASFCRLMEMCLGDQQYITLLFYLDDICVCSSIVDEMLDHIGLVLNHLKEFNHKIKPKKTYFFQSSVVFLGHVLSKNGISPNPEKVSKVKDWPVPKSAKWANPLHELIRPVTTKKKHAGKKIPPLLQNLPPFQWSPECQESFEKLKEALITVPVLSYPDYSKPFILEMDASLKGLGAVLSQEDSDGNVHVVSFMSHTLKPYEKSMKNYSSVKLKLLALKWSVCEKFKDYLIGSKFTLLTDNNPLMYVHTSRLGTSQICWLSDLALFNFDIKYCVGKCNQAADTLSR